MRFKMIGLSLCLLLVSYAGVHSSVRAETAPADRVPLTRDMIKLNEDLQAQQLKAMTTPARIGEVSYKQHKLGLFCKLKEDKQDHAVMRCIVGAKAQNEAGARSGLLEIPVVYQPLQVGEVDEVVDYWINIHGLD